ncbi:MAG: protein-disulfide reductase DsbD [Burkholderiales bacterium]
MRFLLTLLLLASWPVSAAEPPLLEPEQAFRFMARLADANTVEVNYQIAPGYYLYRDKFRFAVEPASVALGAPQLPPGKLKKDEFFGEVEVYREAVKILLPLRHDGTAKTASVTVVSQGCADIGVCYVPQEHRAELDLVSPVAAADGGAFSRAGAAFQAEDTRIAGLFRGGFWLLVASFFGFGLLLAFTPCMLPMVPILSGIIAGRGHHLTRMHGFLLAAAYVLGMALTYALAGVAAGLSGAMLAAALQSPWVLGAFATIFVALALAMFGFYELQLPVALQSRLADASNRLHGGHFAGVFSMGILSALIVGPCVAAPLAGALLYISQSGDVVLGGSALFAMGLGMGAPLLAVGASAGALIPKAGPWMDTVRRFFGVLLLAVAIYLVSPLVPLPAQMLAWAALLIVSAIYMGAIDPLPVGAHGFQKFSKGAGVIALAAGIAFLIGALSGSRDLLQPLSGLRASPNGASPAAAAPAVAFRRVNSVAELENAIRAAAGKPVMLDFYADWCVSCKELERYTFSDPRVQTRFAGMLTLQADVTANTAEHAALLRRFRLFGPPGIVFFDRNGNEINGLRVIGFQPADRFVAVLDQVIDYR